MAGEAEKVSEVAGNLTLNRYGEDIHKIAARHLVKQSNMSKAVRRSSFEAATKSVKSGRIKDALWDFHYAKNRGDEIISLVDEIYDEFGVTPSTISPEHVTRMMQNPNFAARFTEWTIENHELFALEHLDLMRGGMAQGAFSQVQRLAKGDLWTPKGLASRANLQRGPRAMFEETSGRLGKEVGIPVDNFMGSLSRAAANVDDWTAAKLAEDTVSAPLAAATKAVGWTSGKTHGFIEATRNFFTSSLERLPFEDRIATQALFDSATAEMTRTSTKIRNYFDEPVSFTNDVGQKMNRKISLEERHLITKHLEQPDVHSLPAHLEDAANFARSEFDRLWLLEDRLGIAGEKIEDYVTHIYGSKKKGREMLMLSRLKMPKAAVEEQASKMSAKVKNPYALHRTIANLEDAAEWFGEGAVEFDIANILHKRSSASARMRAKQSARYLMVSKYGIGGLASSMMMEGANFAKLLRAGNYVRNYVDPTGVHPASSQQLQRLDVLASELAKLDLDKMGELGKHGRRKIPEAQDIIDEAGKVIGRRDVVAKGKGKDRSLVQRDFKATTDGMIKTGERPWLQPVPGKKAQKLIREGKFKRRVARNRSQLTKLTRAVFGKKLGDLTSGEADFLHDFLTGFMNPELLTDKSGKFSKKGWKAKDALVHVNIESGLIRPEKIAFGVADGPESMMRLMPKATPEIADMQASAKAILKRRGVQPEAKRFADVKTTATRRTHEFDDRLKIIDIKINNESVVTVSHHLDEPTRMLEVAGAGSEKLPKGKGLGTVAYLEAINEAKRLGFGFASDSIRKKAAEGVYSKLKKLGLPFKKGVGDRYSQRLVLTAEEVASADIDGLIASAKKDAAKRTEMIGDFSQEQIQSVIREVGERRARSGLSIGEMERASLRGQIKELTDEAEGLRSEAFRLSRSAGPGAMGAFKTAASTVKKIETRIKRNSDKVNKINKKEATRLRAMDKKIAAAAEKISRTEQRLQKSQDKLITLSEKAVKTREKIEGVIGRAKELLGKQTAKRDGFVAESEKLSKAFEKERSIIGTEMKALQSELVSARKNMADSHSKMLKSQRAKSLRELAKERGGEARELSQLAGRRAAEFDKHMKDINGQYLLPRSFVSAINDSLDSGFDFTQNHHRFLRAWQDFQKVWKIPLTLPFAEHHFRNALTNVGLTATALGLRMLNPTIWRSAANVTGYLLFKTGASTFGRGKGVLPAPARKAMEKLAKRTEKDWEKVTITTVDGAEYNVKEIADEALKRGVNHGFVHAELGFTPFQTFDQGASGVITPALTSTWNIVSGSMKKSMVAAEAVFDVPFRIAMFTDSVIQGSTFDEAAEVVRSQLNDWSRLSQKEKVYMRTAMPFYSWTQFSMERAFKDAIAKPGRFVAPIKTVEAANRIILDSEPPPDYQPGFINSRLGIWSGPNEHGYYQKLVGFGLNQEEALRQASAFADFARIFAHEGIKIFSTEAAHTIAPPPRADEAGLRVLAQMDFVAKGVLEAWRGRQFFDGTPTGTRAELLMLENSRLEQGKGWELLDKGIAENKDAAGVTGAMAAGLGGKWLQNWLEYKPGEGNRSAKVNAYKRWLLGQTPVSRFVGVYEKRVKNRDLGEVNYKVAATHVLGLSAYRYHPSESRYYRDRARINSVARTMRQAHAIDSGMIYWDTGLVTDPEDPVTKKTMENLKLQIKVNPRNR